MKKLFFLFVIFICCLPIFAQNDDKNTTLFCIYSDENVLMLRDNAEELPQKFGEPLSQNIVPTKALNDAYDTFTIQYPHFEIQKWKGFPSVNYITLKDSDFYVSDKRLKIGECTIDQVLEVYEELEVADYVFTNDENNNKILVISFRTWDKSYMAKEAGSCDYVTIYYGFDYESKLCVGIQLAVYDD